MTRLLALPIKDTTMARFLPEGWRCSSRAAEELSRTYDTVSTQVRLIATRYRQLPYPSPEDFHQEGMLAATFAIDTYTPNRGKLAAYIQIVVSNAMAMVAAEVSAQSRAPKIIEEGGNKVSALISLEPEMLPGLKLEASPVIRENTIRTMQSKTAGRRRIESLKLCLAPDARLILDLKMNTPLELTVLSRNLHGRNKLTNHAISHYTGLTLSRVEKSLREIRAAAREAGLDTSATSRQRESRA